MMYNKHLIPKKIMSKSMLLEIGQISKFKVFWTSLK